MAIINVPTKSAGDQFTSGECNEIVDAIKILQVDTGWGFYVDDSQTDIAPQVFSSGLFENVINNGATKREDQLPYVGGVQFPLYDGSQFLAGIIDAKYSIHIRFKAKVNANDSSFQIGFDVGLAEPELIGTQTMPRGQNIYHDYLITVPAFVSPQFLANGAFFQLQCNDELSVYGARYFYSVDYVPIGV